MEIRYFDSHIHVSRRAGYSQKFNIRILAISVIKYSNIRMAQNATIMRQIFAKFWINYKINRVKQFLILKSILDKKINFLE